MAKLKLHEILDGYESSGGEEFVGKRFFRREITGSLTVSTSKKKKSKITRLAESAGKILGYTCNVNAFKDDKYYKNNYAASTNESQFFPNDCKNKVSLRFR